MKKLLMIGALVFGLAGAASAQVHEKPKGPLPTIQSFLTQYQCGPSNSFKEMLNEMEFKPILISTEGDPDTVHTFYHSKKLNVSLVALYDNYGNACLVYAAKGFIPVQPNANEAFNPPNDRKM